MILRFSLMSLVRSLAGAAAMAGPAVVLTTAILNGGQTNDSGAGAPIKGEDHNALVDYFGAAQPGDNAEIFAPGVVSRPDRFEARIAFSPDLRECYLTETDATFSRPKLLVARRNNDEWTEFAAVPFGSKFRFCHEPFLSADNRRLYFTAEGDKAGNLRDLWMIERTTAGWGAPSRLPAPINSDAAEFYFGQSSDGTVVFASNRPGGRGDFDLYYAQKSADGTFRAVDFGGPINTPGPEYDPCISSANEYAPALSPDGRYLFFVRHDGKQSDIFWMATAQLTRGNYLQSNP
jgi:hypothetical protein